MVSVSSFSVTACVGRVGVRGYNHDGHREVEEEEEEEDSNNKNNNKILKSKE